MRFCWYLLAALLPTVCRSFSIVVLTDEDFKEDFRKFREEEPGQDQVSLLMNYLERYELYDEVDFAKRDFGHKFYRVRQILLKLDMIDESKVVQEVGTRPVEDILRVKYSIPRIEPEWKHYRWQCSGLWRNGLKHLATLDTAKPLPQYSLSYGHGILLNFKLDHRFEQGRQYVETNFPQAKQQLTHKIKRFLSLFVSTLKLGDGIANQGLALPKVDSYLRLVNLWSRDDEATYRAWIGLLRDSIDRPPNQTFPESVQIRKELSMFFVKVIEGKMAFKDFVTVLIREYETATDEVDDKLWKHKMYSFRGKPYLMVLRDVLSGSWSVHSCVLFGCKYVLAPAGAIATFGLVFNKLAYGQFFPYWPTEGNTTLLWNTSTPLVITQQPSGWTNWQAVALVVVAIITILAICLALIYYYLFQATETANLSISGKDTAGATTIGSTTTSSASSDNKSR